MAMNSSDWLAPTRAGRLAQAKNIALKAVNFKDELNLTPDWLARMTLNAEVYETVFDSIGQIRATVKDLGDWAEAVYESKETDEPVANAPVFQLITLPADAMQGLDQTLRDFAEYCKVQPGYTKAIGLDLMIAKPDAEPVSRDDMAPEIKIKTLPNYTISGEFKKQGLSAVQFEYQPKGGVAWQKFFAQKSPFTFQIAPAVPNQPESGFVRAVYMDGNQTVGIYSPLFPVTVSQ